MRIAVAINKDAGGTHDADDYNPSASRVFFCLIILNGAHKLLKHCPTYCLIYLQSAWHP
jgi:hypothetical protein